MFYLINKPKDWTSFDVLKKLRGILSEKKIGHTGTLDPFATGCLLVATGNSTKLISLLEGGYKRYRTTLTIDGTSETLDPDSIITEFSPSEYSHKLLSERVKLGKEGLKEFLLRQTEQIPPKYSAIHIDGKRAYDLARKGIEFHISKRPIEIIEVTIHTFQPPFFDIEVVVSSGTYIRSLAPTIGEYFGTGVGYLLSLDRLSIVYGAVEFSKSDAFSIEDIDVSATIDYEELFPSLGKYELSKEEQEKVLVGQPIPFSKSEEKRKYFLGFEGVIISLAEYRDGYLHVLKNNI